MSHTDHPSPAPRTTPSTPHPTPSETTMSHPATTPARHLVTLTALLTIVLTTALPLGEALGEALTTTTTASPSQTTPGTPTSPRPSKADRAAAHHDGCRQQTSTATGTLLARPSCRSGMPVTRDRGLAQVPPQVHDDQGPVAPNEVPPAWSGHWRQAAHSPYHRSQA